MSTIFTFDIGTTSVGWAVASNKLPIDAGVHVFPVGVIEDKYLKSKSEVSKSVARRNSRMMARMNHRYKIRRGKLAKYLKEEGFPEPIGELKAKELYGLRAKALDGPIELEELVRLWFLFNKRRGFKSSRKADSTADKETSKLKKKMNELSQEVKDKGFRTIGEYFAHLFELGDTNNPADGYFPSKKIRTRHVLRADYLNEFDLIWAKQSTYHNLLTESRKKVIRDYIIYHQRKLKSAKGLVAKCRFEPRKRVCAKSNPAFQEFRIWQTLRNLKVTAPDYDRYNDFLTINELNKAVAHLMFNTTITKAELMAICDVKGKNVAFSDNFKAIKGHTTNAKVVNAIETLGLDGKQWLSRQNDVQLDRLWQALYFFDDQDNLTKHLSDTLGYSFDEAQALSNVGLEPDYGSISYKALTRKIVDKETGELRYGILHYMRQGLRYDEACTAAGYEFNDIINDSRGHELEEDINQLTLDYFKKKGLDMPNSPLVKKVLAEALRVTKALVGKHGRPDEIRIELARTLQKPKEQREQEKAKNDQAALKRTLLTRFLQEQKLPSTKSAIDKVELWLDLECVTNELEDKIKEAQHLFKKDKEDEEKTQKGKKATKPKTDVEAFLESLASIKDKDYEKYKLWLECNRISVYSGKIIGLVDLLDENGAFEIEHIIPYSFCQDNSFANKTLCEKEINAKKNNRTAYEYFASLGSEKLDEFKKRVQRHFKGSKKERLLLDLPFSQLAFDSLTPEQQKILDKFRPDALAATAFASRKLVAMMRYVAPKVYVTSGAITAMLRHEWGLNAILSLSDSEHEELKRLRKDQDNESRRKELEQKVAKNRNDHRHHALDAIVIASTSQSMIQKLNTEGAQGFQKRRMRNGGFEIVSRIDAPRVNPNTGFNSYHDLVKSLIDNILVTYRKNSRLFSIRTNPYKWAKKEFKAKMAGQHKTLAPRGSLHNDTIYGKKQIAGTDLYVVKKSLASIKTGKDLDAFLDKIIDPAIRNIIKAGPKPPFKFDDKEGHYGFFLTSKNKDPEVKIPILSVRIAASFSKMVPLPRGYAEPDNNYGLALYEDDLGNREELIQTFYDAFQNAKAGLPVFPDTVPYPASIKKKGSGLVKRLTLQRYDMVVLTSCPVPRDQLTNPAYRKQIAPFLYMVRKLSSTDYGLRAHNASTNDFEEEQIRIKSLGKANLIKVKLGLDGSITQVLEAIGI